MQKFFIIFLSIFLVISLTTVNAATPKQWTFLIYLNGKNSLDDFGVENLKSMEKIGSNDQVNIVVQWGSYATGKTVRMLIQKSTHPSKITSPVIENLGSIDMGSYKTLQEFILWGVEHYPADHYFINVWNHGGGWHLRSKGFTASRDISWDDITGNSITTEQLGTVMAVAAKTIGHKVDIYGSDACLMAMAEVADEMGDSINYFVGSQELEPGAGWPYADFLSRWQAIPNATPSQVATILVHEYVKSYQNGSNGTDEVTFSAYDMNKFSKLNSAIAQLNANIMQLNATERDAVFKATKYIQRFGFSDYADLSDFMRKLSTASIRGLNSQTLMDVKDALNETIIANERTADYANAHGMSVWIPLNYSTYHRRSDRYHHLQFNSHTGWGEMLGVLLQGRQAVA